MAEKKLSEELRHCLEDESCRDCLYHVPETKMICKVLLQKAHEVVKRYEEMFPCEVGDTVYVLAECESIPEQLDGTLWDENGAHGTATGYYCPYEDNCPFDDEDFEDCEKYKEKTAVFEDTVGDITIGEDGVWIRTVNCCVCSQIGLYIFLTKSEAWQALKEMEGEK